MQKDLNLIRLETEKKFFIVAQETDTKYRISRGSKNGVSHVQRIEVEPSGKYSANEEVIREMARIVKMKMASKYEVVKGDAEALFAQAKLTRKSNAKPVDPEVIKEKITALDRQIKKALDSVAKKKARIKTLRAKLPKTDAPEPDKAS